MHSKFQLALFFGGHCTQLGATLREINVIESNCLSISPHITPKINYKTRGNRQPVGKSVLEPFFSKETGHLELELTRLNSFILIVLKNSKQNNFHYNVITVSNLILNFKKHFEIHDKFFGFFEFTAVRLLRRAFAFQFVQFRFVIVKMIKLSLAGFCSCIYK